MSDHRLRRAPSASAPASAHGLNIYPLMDLMTILLVFLIAQLAAAQAEVAPSADLQVPFSTSDVEPIEALAIQVSRHAITVDGEEVVRLHEGAIGADDKLGGTHGLLIHGLADALARHRNRAREIAALNPQRPFTGEVRIVADRRTPYRTLTEIVYTLGRAEYDSVHFVVVRAG